jgi:uncharacterized lipoprotein YddW (UPF0748 family)
LLLSSAAFAASATANKPILVQAVTRAAGLEARVMWMDATGNLDNLDTPAKVADVMEHCRRANINTVVVDVKPLVGEVLYPSKVAKRLTTYRGKQYDPNFDLLQTAINEGRSRGLKVYAAINVFAEGNKLVGRGLAYDKPQWQAITYVPARSILTEDGEYPLSPVIDDGPPADGIAAYTSGSGRSKPVKPSETYSIVAGDMVQATVGGGAVQETGVPIPENGTLLVGDGAAGAWMADKLRSGVRVRFTEQDTLIPIVQAPTERVSAFVNPIAPEPRAHELAVMKEIAQNYPVDGIVFDRMRYSSLSTDYSDLSRREFEKWAGVKTMTWPGDILQYTPDPTQEAVRGPYFKPWLEWRARNMHSFAKEATRVVRAARPTAKCAVYVGSWYPVYYSVGVNWASDEYNAAYDWMSESYHETGFAPLMDWLCTGTYYPEPYRATAKQNGRDPDATVEAAGELSNKVVSDASFVYASLSVTDFATRPAALTQAIQAGLSETEGVMLFDLVYIIQNRQWGVLEAAFPRPAIAPHDVPELLSKIADVRAILPPAPEPDVATPMQNWKLVVKE